MMIRFSIGDVLSRSLSILGKNFVAFFLITALVQAPALALQRYAATARGDAGIVAAAGLLLLDVVLRAFGAVVCAVAYHDLRTEKEGVNSQDLARVFD
jgi:hypothetical protein